VLRSFFTKMLRGSLLISNVTQGITCREEGLDR
jgi:hypothetical protein